MTDTAVRRSRPQGRARARKNSVFAEMSATDYFWVAAGGGEPRIITDISAAQRNTRYHQNPPTLAEGSECARSLPKRWISSRLWNRKTLIAYETLPDGAYWCGRSMRSRPARKPFWHAIAAERISANSGLARTLAKNGSESIAG